MPVRRVLFVVHVCMLRVSEGKKRFIWPYCWWKEVSTQFAQQFVTAVTAPPLVDRFIWSLNMFFIYINNNEISHVKTLNLLGLQMNDNLK